MSPAQIVVSHFGGTRPTARALDRNPSAVHKWLSTGNIPQVLHKKILKKVPSITPEELIFGRKKGKKNADRNK